MIGFQLGAATRDTLPAAALQQAHAAPPDSVVVASPLPGGVATIVRFMLNAIPTWAQIGAVILAALLAALVLWQLYRRRQGIRTWAIAQSRGMQAALLAAMVVLLAGAAWFGTATWNYTQHENEFCSGCHIMNPAFQKFADPKNRHGKLSCHACHQQSLYASARQLYMWVAERPAEIGEHATVPNKVCAGCHVTGDTAVWQRIASTAGHRVHLESDSSALKNLQCVTCHGVELHRFLPVNQTCGQSNCHKPKDTQIVLGKMADQTDRHCTSCHAFTAEVPLLATRDSARGTLVPGKAQCLGCHEMQKVLAEFDEGKDPHGGKCGTCHNPHTQKTVAAAANTCATAGCHANWRDEPFHMGSSHRRIAPKCLTCHLAHRAKVDASNCEDCHRSVRSRGKARPPLPFDTASALRRVTTVMPAPRADSSPIIPAAFRHSITTPSRGGPRDDDDEFAPEAPIALPELPGSGLHDSRSPPVPADSFPHARHAKLACLTCHVTGTGRGRLTFERPRGCAICHHQAPATGKCASCHRTDEYAGAMPATVTVTVPGHEPSARPVGFVHAVHSARTCVECHSTPVTLAPPPEKAQCRECHGDHHAAGRTCTSCHTMAAPATAHRTPETAHQRCDACHTATTIAQLTPTRTFCATCHAAKAKNHFEPRECTTCHFLSEPATYRAELLTSPAP